MCDHSVEIMQIVFVQGYFRILQENEIFIPKKMNMISTDDQTELVLVFMPYYY